MKWNEMERKWNEVEMEEMERKWNWGGNRME